MSLILRFLFLCLLLISNLKATHAQSVFSSWQSLPSTPSALASEAVLVGGLNERASIFVLGTDGRVYQSAQGPTGSNFGPWTPISPSTEKFAASTETRRIAAARNEDGRLEVFAWRQDKAGTIAHAWQTSKNGAWTQWVDIPPPSTQWSGADLFAANNADGHLEVFVKNGFDSHLFHTWQVSPNGGWSGVWHDLRGPTPSMQISGRIVWGRNADGRQELFARSSGDNQIWSVAQFEKNGGWNSSWTPVTGVGGPGSDPINVLSNFDGRLEIFSRPTVNLWNAWQTSPGVWGSPWAQLGSPPRSAPVSFASLRLPYGQLAAFLWSAAGLYEINQVVPGSGFGKWHQVTGLLGANLGPPTNILSALELNGQTMLLGEAQGRLFWTRAAVLKSQEKLPESVSKDGQRLAVVFDFDTDSCYPSPAIYANGTVNPGLEENASGLTSGCRAASQLVNSNTYYRKATITRNGTEFAVHMYALYFMKDKTVATPFDLGHRHDWEFVLVWTANGVMTHVNHSAHGGVTTPVPRSQLSFDGMSGNRVKIVYHKDSILTHTFRLGEPDETPENDLGKWLTPVIVEWQSMFGIQASNEKVRSVLNAHDFGAANCSVNDFVFPAEIEKSTPPGYPTGAEWRAAAAQ